MILGILEGVVSASVFAGMGAVLPAPALPRVSVTVQAVGMAAFAPGIKPSYLPVIAPVLMTRAAVLPTAAVTAAVPAVAAAGIGAGMNGRAAEIPAAKAAMPALAGKADWAAVFDGRGAAVGNGIKEEVPAQTAQSTLDELDFWSELLKTGPLAPLEKAALTSFLGSLDGRADKLARQRAASERVSERSAGGSRHEALLEAASRWRRLLKRGLDATRAEDLAGEARNHREAYLASPEPGLPGYARAAKTLEKLEIAFAARNAAEARDLINRFEEDLIHRRSLKVSIIVRQAKEGGTTRASVRFALPGTTLKTMLKRVGGIPEKPEVRVNGGAWTPYAGLDLRGTLKDETLLEILLP